MGGGGKERQKLRDISFVIRRTRAQTLNFLLTCIRSRRPWGPAACSRGRCRRRRHAWCASCPRPASSPACCTGTPGNSSLRAADVVRGLAPLAPPLCVHTSAWMHRLDYFSTTALSNTRQKTVKDFIWVQSAVPNGCNKFEYTLAWS